MRDTQKEAWQKMQDHLGERQRKVLAKLKEGAATGYELAIALGWFSYRTLPRITELCRKGLVKDTGQRRVNPSSGRNTIVWAIKEATNGNHTA